MKFALIGIIGLLGGIIVSKAVFNSEISEPASVTYSQPQDLAEMEEMLEEMRQIRNEINTLLKAEKTKFVELLAQVETLSEKVDVQLDPVNAIQQNTQRGNNRNQNQIIYDVDALVNAGLTTVEAERVLELEAEARDRIQELLEDPENRNRNTLREVAQTYSDQIRSELGDYGYETYLEATGRATSIPVGSVEPDSAGANAGLLPGDQITSYAGARVFSINEIQEATASGIEGETVVVEVLRDDQTLTLVMPRGEIGISTRNRRQNN